MVGKRETGFAVPPPRPGVQAQDAQKNGGPTGNQFEAGGIKGSANGGSMPYHASVLPVRAGPKETSGFGDDAFKPLWKKERESAWNGFGAGR